MNFMLNIFFPVVIMILITFIIVMLFISFFALTLSILEIGSLSDLRKFWKELREGKKDDSTTN